MRASIPAIIAILVLAHSARAEWADWVIDADLASNYISNVNQASISSEQEWDFSVQPAVDFGRIYQLPGDTRILAGARIGGDVSARFENLNAFDAEGRISLFHKFGLGDAPWLQAFAGGGYREVGANQRSGPGFRVGTVLGKRFSPRFDARLEYSFTRRFGGQGPPVVAGAADDVFDQGLHQVRVEAAYLLGEPLLLSAGFTYSDGDFISNAQASRFSLLATNRFEAVARDQVFGGWAYRFKGRAYEPFLRLNYGIGDFWSVDFGYRFRFSEGGSFEYRNHIVSAVLYFRY